MISATCKQGSNVGGEPISFDKMAVFDQLPAPIRRALADAPYSFNPLQVEQAWRRRGMTAHAYARRMRAVFRKAVVDRYRARGLWGLTA